LDWRDFCDNSTNETFIIGNPPYKGESSQDKAQKSDMDLVFKGKKNYKKQDYIACWFLKASEYINSTTKAAFISTDIDQTPTPFF
jgi:type I restriction-modification system DNA methylase subunit